MSRVSLYRYMLEAPALVGKWAAGAAAADDADDRAADRAESRSDEVRKREVRVWVWVWWEDRGDTPTLEAVVDMVKIDSKGRVSSRFRAWK